MLLIKLSGPLSQEDEGWLKKHNVDFGCSKSLTGGQEIIDVLIPLAPVIILQLADIIKEYIKNRRLISIKYDDIELQNVAINDVDELLKKLNVSPKKSVSRKATKRRKGP